jgi:hypothetical protein
MAGESTGVYRMAGHPNMDSDDVHSLPIEPAGSRKAHRGDSGATITRRL